MSKKRRSTLKRFPAGRPTQDVSEQVTERLRNAGLHIFIEKGFAGTSMEAVSRAAGITKRTLYARYADKSALFADVVQWALERYHWEEPEGAPAARSLEVSLTEIARLALARAKDPDIVRLSRMAIAEAARIPDLAPRAFTTTWFARIGTVAALLTLHAKAGKISVENIEIAAEQFLGMVGALPAWLAAFGHTRPPQAEEQYVQQAVASFLRSVRPQRANYRGIHRISGK
jgi:AcrR family transcriptional regulator